MFKSLNDIKPYYTDSITNILRSVGISAGNQAHPEFVRAIRCVAVAFGVTETELINGSTRTDGLQWKEGVTITLRSILQSAGGNVHSEFVRAIHCIATQFGISRTEL